MKNIFKISIGVFVIIIIAGTLIFTQNLAKKIKEREMEVLSLYIEIYKSFFDSLNSESQEGLTDDTAMLNLMIEKVTPTISSPFIFTDENDKPIKPYETWSLNIDFSHIKTNAHDSDVFINNKLAEMKEQYKPFLVKDQPGKDGKVIQKLYYMHSDLVSQLRWVPITGLFIILGLMSLAYLAFSYFKKSEESLVWVGMAKEAAHQLGTPLSSLMAWQEILRYGKDNPEQIEMTVSEMSKDIDRLNTIAKRFSKIGSIPDRTKVNLAEVLENICRYFDLRLPHLGKNVDLDREFDSVIYALINVDLFAWVIENLLKNSSEAIDDLTGKITIVMYNDDEKIFINISDTGKGMTNKNKRKVFNAGFTTKKRGWGLGLTLTKRIIEEYHEGKIYIKETQLGKGTTFAIELPIYKEVKINEK